MAPVTNVDSMPDSPLSGKLSPSGEQDETLGNDFPTNGLRTRLAPFDLEKAYDYEPGGHHPVHLGDLLGSDRYQVIHKLGSGGFAIVWLCQDLHADSPKYVALKILMAEVSTDDCPELVQGKLLKSYEKEDGADGICLFLDHFKLDGPNGCHLCFVYPVLGPKLSSGLLRPSEDLDKTLRGICLSTVRAMAFLHKKGICHGDFTPNNVLQRLSGLDGLSEHEVLEIIGEPRTSPLVTQSDEPHQLSTAPQYAVYPVDWEKVNTSYFSNEPCVNDLGEAFNVNKPPKDLGIPPPYRSPELFLEKSTSNPNVAGYGSDIWALGCTLFELRTGRKFLNLFDDDDDSYLDAMVAVLGKMPEPWWSTTWEIRRRWWRDEADDLGRAVPVHTPPIEPVQTSPKTWKSTVHPCVAEGAQSLEDMLAPGVWYVDTGGLGENQHRDIPDQEKKLFAALLGLLLKWQPQERISAEEASRHEWFQM